MRRDETETQAGQAIGLGKSPGDDQVRVLVQQTRRRRQRRIGHVFVVGLVDDHERARRYVGQEARQLGGREPGAGRIVRIRQVDDAGAIGHQAADRFQIVPARHGVIAREGRRHAQLRTRGLGRQRIHGEAILRDHHIVGRPGEDLGDHHQQFVRTVAEHDLGRIQAMAGRDGQLQVAAERIRITVQFVQAVEQGLARPRAWAQRILVRAQLHQELSRGLRLPAQRDQVQARVVGFQALDAGLRQRMEIGLGHFRAVRPDRSRGSSPSPHSLQVPKAPV